LARWSDLQAIRPESMAFHKLTRNV